jgi:hypothetical protein
MFRRLAISIFALMTALLAADRSTLGQSTSSYPWCFHDAVSGARSCYFESYQQCFDEASAQGGYCRESPYYQPNKGTEAPREETTAPGKGKASAKPARQPVSGKSGG